MNDASRSAAVPSQGSNLAASMVVVAATMVVVSAALLGNAGGQAAGWCAGLGAVLVIVGGLGGLRGAVGTGVIAIATASVVVTYETSLGYTLAVNAAVALSCLAVLVATDLSFVTRRNAFVEPATSQGFMRLHTISGVVGVGVAVVALGVVLSVDWPGAALLLPAVLLACGAAGLVAVTRKHKRSIREQQAAEGHPRDANGLPPGPLHYSTKGHPPTNRHYPVKWH